jgi:hypothetical protein
MPIWSKTSGSDQKGPDPQLCYKYVVKRIDFKNINLEKW